MKFEKGVIAPRIRTARHQMRIRMVCITKEKSEEKRIKVRSLLELQPKIKEAESLVREALQNSKKPIIAFSGGKDSLVVLDIVRKIAPDTIGVFEDTTNEYPETIKYVRQIPNIVWLHPKKTFIQCVKEYGLPENKLTGKRHGSACCYHLKELPALEYYKKNNVDLVFTGLTSDESRNRFMFFKKMGAYYFYKKDKYFKCHPIHNWTVDDVWTYIKHYNLKYNRIYDILGKDRRCGCMLCTAYLSWQKVTSEYNPKHTHWLMRKKGFKLLSDFHT